MELRHIWTSTELADYLTFPHAAQVFCVQRHTTHIVSNTERSETVYGITSLSAHHANPETIMRLLRGHWSIENRLHWVRDVTFDEDRCRIRKGKGAQNMACFRNLAISLLRMAGVRYIPTGLRACSRLGQGVLRIIGLNYGL